jgi:arsenite oxidase large subunit
LKPTVDAVARRDVLASLVATLTAAGCRSAEVEKVCADGYLIPPLTAKVQTTACAYCIVGCGYKTYTWPVGVPSGGTSALENAMSVDFPTAPGFGAWISPEMYNVATVDGTPHHVVVVPDTASKVINLKGNHNLGGSLAQRFYRNDAPTKDRFLKPALRVGSELLPISWEQATALVGDISRHVLDTAGPLAWAMKTYSYQFYENTYAITKLCFAAIKTPCWAPHDAPADGSSTPGLSDAGLNAFSAAYEDWAQAEVIFVSGVGLYDQHAILFDDWVVRGGAKLIVVNPRKDETAQYALENGGLFLQVRPGTDTLLHHAIARVIVESGWTDGDFIAGKTVNAADLAAEGTANARRAKYGMTFEAYRDFLLADERFIAENAAATVGVSAAQIREAARLLAAPKPDQTRIRASYMIEKGNFWSHNYANSSSLVSLALLTGAGNRPGRMVSRAGGHQRGMLTAASYPLAASPDTVDGRKAPLNLDRWLLSGKLRFAWVVGNTWVGGGSAHAGALYEQVRQQARASPAQLEKGKAFAADGTVNIDYVLEIFRARVNQGGMVFVQQDMYPQPLTALADIVLPAASWGEVPFTRMQGERRLRHYAQIVDAPGETRADWKIVADIAKRMKFDGFDWPDENAVFEEAASRSATNEQSYLELVNLAKAQGKTGHQLLASLGTEGIQCPIRLEGSSLLGTVRLHEGGFSTMTKKAMFVKADWDALVLSRSDVFAPRAGELQIINRRHGAAWSSLVEDARIPYRQAQFPENTLEINSEDAARLGIQDGAAVLVETVDLMAPIAGGSQMTTGRMQAKAVISDLVKPGVACAYFNFQGDPKQSTNALVPNSPDPVSNLFSFKLGRGSVRLA